MNDLETRGGFIEIRAEDIHPITDEMIKKWRVYYNAPADMSFIEMFTRFELRWPIKEDENEVHSQGRSDDAARSDQSE